MTNTAWNSSGTTTLTDGDAASAPEMNDTLVIGCPPIGSVLGYHPTLSGVPSLPGQGGWVECNGQTLSDSESPLDGEVIPDLNGTTDADSRFLRGTSSATGSTGGSISHSHTVTGAGQITPAPSESGTSVENHIPPFFEIRWIMRVK